MWKVTHSERGLQVLTLAFQKPNVTCQSFRTLSKRQFNQLNQVERGIIVDQQLQLDVLEVETKACIVLFKKVMLQTIPNPGCLHLRGQSWLRGCTSQATSALPDDSKTKITAYQSSNSSFLIPTASQINKVAHQETRQQSKQSPQGHKKPNQTTNLRVLNILQGFSLSTPHRTHCVTIFFSPSHTGQPECSVN